MAQPRFIAFAAACVLLPITVAVAAGPDLAFEPDVAELEGDGPVLSVHQPGKARWTATAINLDLDAGRLEATFTNDIGGTMTIAGVLDQETWGLNATIHGNESYGEADGDHRHSTFSGTVVATLFEGGTATSADDLNERAIPRARATGGPERLNLLWLGTSEVEFATYDEQPPSDRRNYVPGEAYGGSVRLGVTGDLSAPGAGPPLRATISSVEGDVEVVRVGASDPVPAMQGFTVGPGDSVATGPEGRITLDFGYATLQVPSLTHFTVDASVQEDTIHRTQLFLDAGSVRATIHQPASVRGDFSVATPGANAAIRGSGMVVSYDPAAGSTRVFVTDDEAFVTADNGTEEVRVAEGQRVSVDDGQAVGSPAPFAPAELPSELAEEEVPIGGGDGGGGVADGGGAQGNGSPAPAALLVVVAVGLAALAALRPPGRGR